MSLRIRAGRGRRPAAARRIAFVAAVAAVMLTACSTDNPLSLRPDVDLDSRTASLSGGGMRELVPDDPYLRQAEVDAATSADGPDVTYQFDVGPQPVSQGAADDSYTFEQGAGDLNAASIDDQGDAVDPYGVDKGGPARAESLGGGETVDPYAVNAELAAASPQDGMNEPVDPYAVNPELGDTAGTPVRTAALTRPVDPYGLAEPQYAEPAPERMSADEIDCRRELKRLDVSYVELDPISDGGSCGIAHPVKVSAIGRVKMQPAATLRCEMAAAFAAWTRKELVPAARSRYFSGVRTIHQASSYSCRKIRRSRGVLSEHGKGNALDVARFELSNGRDIEVEKPGFFSWRTKGFLNSVRSDGCSYFTTVLGPGYDRDHKDHFHFDLKSRRSGYRACR